MKFLRKAFGTHNEESPAQSTPSGSTSKQVQGVLILTRRPLDDSFALLEQIVALQRSKGYSISVNCISKAAATERFDDEAFLHEKIRKEFVKLGGDDLIKRTKRFPCQASGGNSGVYCVIFDRP